MVAGCVSYVSLRGDVEVFLAGLVTRVMRNLLAVYMNRIIIPGLCIRFASVIVGVGIPP